MREIKFRAWDNLTKTMIQSDLFMELVYGNPICLPYNKKGEKFAFTKNGLIDGIQDHLRLQGNPFDMKNLELIQYTGLKDKQGKEICEGDVVKENKPYGDFNHIVRWSIENSGFWLGGACPLNKGEAEIIEVIGNIYENPELMEEI